MEHQLDNELISPDYRLLWSNEPGWQLERRDDEGSPWHALATFGGGVPASAGDFARWLLEKTQLHPDIVEDSVLWLRDSQPQRFLDEFDDEGPCVHSHPVTRQAP